MSEVRYRQCQDCHATGIFKGTMEPDNVGVVCSLCRGSGKVESFRNLLFQGLQRRNDITTVFSGVSDTRGTYVGKGIDYDAFFKGSMPGKDGTTTVVT